jgi:hypothetical protein
MSREANEQPMAPTLVALAVGLLLAVALLGAAFDRRSAAIVAGAAVVPDLDAAFAVAGPGGPNATLHSVFVPLGAAAVLYYDTRVRERSRLADRWGARGVRVAWVAVAAYAVAGIGLDAATAEGVAALYPLSDRYYAVAGRFLLSTQEGIVQTYTSGGGPLGLASPGTVDTYTVEAVLSTVEGERRLRLVESGWQAIVVATALVAAAAKRLTERSDRSESGSGSGGRR